MGDGAEALEAAGVGGGGVRKFGFEFEVVEKPVYNSRLRSVG